MDAKELRQLNMDELKSRAKQLKEDYFKSKFKAQSAEKKDTSIFKKNRKDIARTLTILSEKLKGTVNDRN
jgi:large subunit ribosomal protein L29